MVTQFEILDHEVIVVGQLTAIDVTKVQFGSSNITRDSQSGKTLCIGDDLKSAATDSLKKCASLLDATMVGAVSIRDFPSPYP
ncbi:hypothetical protein K8T06_17145 [bacterium]|nr:hypothetical protein [bacterium]